MAYGTSGDLVPSRTDTATATASTSSAIDNADLYRMAEFTLEVTAWSGSATLDVAIQSYVGGSVWSDIARFTQVSGTGTRVIRGVGGNVGSGSTVVEEAQQALAITAANIRPGPLGTKLRAIYTIGGAPTSITWKVRYGLYS